MNDVWILGAARTPIGRLQGALAQVPAPRLGAAALQAALARAHIPGSAVEEVFFGQVLTAGAGQAPARQTSLYAGIPAAVPCTTVGKVCGSGLQALMLGARAVQTGDVSLVATGGQESMSGAPYLLAGARAGLRMGHAQATDSMIADGLWDPYDSVHMGVCGELCAREKGFSREAQDAFAAESYGAATEAQAKGWFGAELTAVTVPSGKGTKTVEEDEEPAAGSALLNKLPTLRPAFDPQGTITAANASKVNDGAAAVLLGSASAASRFGATRRARVVAMATHAADPKWFTTAPIGAMTKALERAGLAVQDIDLFEINEAFAVVPLVAMQTLGIPRSKVNVHGGAIALGHPIGASGSRIVVTLLGALERLGLRRGLAALCVGGGEGVCIIIDREGA